MHKKMPPSLTFFFVVLRVHVFASSIQLSVIHFARTVCMLDGRECNIRSLVHAHHSALRVPSFSPRYSTIKKRCVLR
jgi:hypothetical protein